MSTRDEALASEPSADKPIAVWRDPTMLAFTASRFVSMTGTQMTWVALPWFVLATTNSPAKMAFVLVAEMVPFGVFGLTVGALVDRWDLKRVMWITDLLNAAAIGSIPLLFALGMLQYWMILVAAALVGTFSAPSRAAEKAVIPDLVGDDEPRLVSANTAVSLATQVTTMTGPVLAGVLIGVMGNANLLWLDAASYVASAVILAVGVWPARRGGQTTTGDVFHDTADGLRFLWNHKLLRTSVLYIIALVFAFVSLIDAAVPVFVKHTLHLGPEAVATLLASWGAGAVVGMLVYGALNRRYELPLGRTLVVLSFGIALPLWIPPATSALVPASVGFFLAGLADGPLTVALHTMQQTETPVALRGRVFSAIGARFMLAAPLGALAAAPVLEAGGAIPWMYAMAGLFTVIAGATLLSPTIRRA
jgi:MFS family permease